MGAVCREIWQDGTSLPGGLHLNPSWRFWFQLGNAARPPFPPRLTPASTQTPSPSTWRLIPSSLVQLAPQDVGAVVGGGVSGYPVARTRGLAPQPGASSPLAQESQVSGLGRKKNVPHFETYQARGRPLRATAAAVAAAAAVPGVP